MKKEIRATLRLRNNLLLSLREQAGLTQKELANRAGISAFQLGKIENFGRQGTGVRGGSKKSHLSFASLRPAVQKLARFFQVEETEIASEYLHQAIKITEIEKEIDHTEIVPLLESQLFLSTPTPEESLIQEEKAEHIRKRLCLITPREEEMVRMTYGIDEDREFTNKEIGQRFKISASRVQSLVKKAEKKMRERWHWPDWIPEK